MLSVSLDCLSPVSCMANVVVSLDCLSPVSCVPNAVCVSGTEYIEYINTITVIRIL